ncbi:MAG: GTP-binding protein, partial [Pseudomonadales bacterium]|nr:GTP-binding protein [Pseudomonadales bacterium]
ALGGHHDHAHDHFDSYVISIGEVDGDKIQTQLSALLNAHNIYRAKGFAAIPGKPMRQVLQAVGTRLECHFDRLWAAAEPRLTQLVFIGKDLDESVLTEALKQAEVASAETV